MKILASASICVGMVVSGIAQTTSVPAGSSSAAAAPAGTSASTSGGITINAATGQIIPAPGNQLIRTNASVANALTNARPGFGRLATNNAPAPRTNITPVQFQNINQLALQLNRLVLPNRGAADQERALTDVLKAAPIGQSRPSSEAISKLAADLTTALPELNLTQQQRRQLAIDINLALNSGNLSPAEAQRVIADARTMLQGGPGNRSEVPELMQTLEGIVAQLQRDRNQSGLAANENTNAPASTAPAPEAGQSGASQTGEGSGSSGATSAPKTR